MAVELLTPHEAVSENPRWHELRRAGVTASEVAAIVGLSPWDSAFSLHWRKANGWDTEPSDEMTTGTILEPAIAGLWAYHCDPHQNLVLARAGLYAHPERPWQLATPDRLLRLKCGCPPPGCWECNGSGLADAPDLAVLELKWAASWDGWGDDGSDDIPVYYRAQVLWQCDVLGLDQWYLGVLGPSGFRSYTGTVGRTAQRDLELMRRRAREFLDRVERGDPPPIDDGHPATIATLKRLHPTVEDVDVEVAPVFADGWRRARALRKRAEHLCDRYEARARDLLAGARRLVTPDGTLIVSRSAYDQSGDTAELTALETDWPTTDRLNPGKALR
jgi:putative phage-type endonuclease